MEVKPPPQVPQGAPTQQAPVKGIDNTLHNDNTLENYYYDDTNDDDDDEALYVPHVAYRDRIEEGFERKAP